MLLHAYGTGGTIRTVFNQANAMAAAGHEVDVVSAIRRNDELRFALDPRVAVSTLVDERADAAVDPPNTTVLRRARAQRRTRIEGRGPEVIPRGEFGIRYFNRYVEKAVIASLRRLSGGVLVTTRPALNLLAARFAPRGVVRIAQEHMNLATHRADVRRAIVRDYPGLDAVAVLTESDRRDYEAAVPGLRVARIPNSLHSLDQEPSTHANRIAVAAGRLVAQKGFDLLIPAFARAVEDHPDWQLRIFGTGEKKAELRALIDEYHLYNHVLLMGHTTDMDAELAKSSLYVLSSRFEGLPMVMIEAMSHGVPVVGFDCPTGPAEVITDGDDGLLVPAMDTDALAAAMSRLMGSAQLRIDMGAAAARAARSFAPHVVHPQWEGLFGELTEVRDRQERRA